MNGLTKIYRTLTKSLYLVCNQIKRDLSDRIVIDSEPCVNDDLNLVIDEAMTEDGLDQSKFSNAFASLLVHGLSKDQKIAKFMTKLEGHRYFCNCEQVDWEGLKEGLQDLLQDISKR